MEVFSLVGKITLDGIAKVENQLNTLGSKLKQNEAALKTIGKGMTAIGAAITTAVGLSVKAAVDIEAVSGAFDNLSSSVGQSGDAILSAIKEASAGTISEYNLMLAANKAMVLGVASNSQEFSTLMTIARDRARAMGLTTTQAFDNIVTGIGRCSPLILDNLGITVNLTEANEEYAKQLGKTVDSLTESEQVHALLNGVLKQGTETMDEASLSTMTVGESLEKLKVSLQDLLTEIGEHLLPILQSITDFLSGVIGKIIEWAENNPELARTLAIVAGALGGVLTAVGLLTIALPKLAAAIATVKAVMAVATGPIGLIITAISLLTVAITALVANWDKVKNFFNNLFGNAKSEALETANVIKERTQKLTQELKDELDKQLKDNLENLDKQKQAALQARDEAIAALKEEYGIEEKTSKSRVELAREASAAKIAALDEEIRRTNEAYNKIIQSYEDEKAAFRKAYDERIRLIDEEYYHQIKIIDATLARKTGQWNDEIDALYDQLDAEAKARKEEERKQRIAELQAAVDSAKTEEEKAEAIAALNEYIAQVEYERWQESIHTQIESLQEKIENEQEAAEEEKRILEEQRQAEIKAEEEKLAAEEARIDGQIANAERLRDTTINNLNQIKEAEDEALANELARLETELSAKIANEEAKCKAVTDNLQKQRDAIIAHHAEMIKEEALYQSALAIASEEVQGGKVTTGTRRWEGYDQNKYDEFWNPEEGYYYVRRFASGGLINVPSLLTNINTGEPYGIMAESGPEWIVPNKPASATNLNIEVAQMIVREEADIKRVARELYSLINMEQRGLGLG